MTAFAQPPITPKAEITRSRLVDLAAKLFIERGYASVSLRDIAGEAGLTKGAIYGHFRSKGQLLVEVIRTSLERADAGMEPGADESPPRSVFNLFIDPGSRELRLLQIDAAAAARHDPDVAAGVAELYAQRNKWILDSLIDIPDAEAIAFIINALASGIGTQEAHGREVPDPGAWQRITVAMFEAAFRAAQARTTPESGTTPKGETEQ